MRYRSTLHRAARDAVRAGALVLVLLGLLTSSAWGYRPFVSTDAAVVERARMEIELGYAWSRQDRSSIFLFQPQLSLFKTG